MCLDVYVGDHMIGRTLANRYREDLKQAGLGSGRHGFMFASPRGVDISSGFVNVRRSLDGVKLDASAGATGVKRHLRVDGPIRRVGVGLISGAGEAQVTRSRPIPGHLERTARA